MCRPDPPYLPTAEDWQREIERYEPDTPPEWALVIGEVLALSDIDQMELDGDAFFDVAANYFDYGDMLKGAILGRIKGWFDFCSDENPMAGLLDDRPRWVKWYVKRHADGTRSSGRDSFRKAAERYWERKR